MGLNNFTEKETKEFTATIKVNNTSQDITSDTVTFYLVSKPNATPVISKDADVSLGNGQYKVILTTNDTDVEPGVYFWEIWWVLSNGKEYRLDYGQITIKDSYYK